MRVAAPYVDISYKCPREKKVGPRMGLGKGKYNPLRIDFGPQEKAITTSCFVSTLSPLRFPGPDAAAAASGIIRLNNPLSDLIAFVSRYGIERPLQPTHYVYLRRERLGLLLHVQLDSHYRMGNKKARLLSTKDF